MNNDQTDAEILKDILEDLADLVRQTRQSSKELRQIELELKQALAQKQITQFSFDIKAEQVRRSHQDIDFCLRSLDRQRKICLEKLRELE